MAKYVTLQTLPEVRLLEDITRESAARVIEQIAMYRGSAVALSLFSNGGDAQGALAVAQYISNPANQMDVEARIYGNAASGAMIIAAASQRAYISEGAFSLIHFAYAPGVDDEDLSEEDKAVLASINETQVDMFVQRTGRKKNEVRKLMDENKYITADEAMAFGLFDGIIPQAARLAAYATLNQMSEKKTITVKVNHLDAFKAMGTGEIQVPAEAVEQAAAAEVDALKKQVEDLTRERDEMKAAKEAADTAKATAEDEKTAEVTAKAAMETELAATKEAVGKYVAAIEQLKKTPLVAQTLPDGTQVVIPATEEKKETAAPLSKRAERAASAKTSWEEAFNAKFKSN